MLGRASELAVLDGVLSDVRRGESRLLVLRGEAGIGKTTLLTQLVRTAPEMSVVRAVGMESEMELAFASLHQLCAPMLHLLPRLAAPQRQALEIVFGLSEGASPDRFLVGLATLSLLSEAAEERPLLCVIDDAQWLDKASALSLTFVARRLMAEPIGMVFATRAPVPELAHLPELEVRGLRQADARTLLSSTVRFPLDAQVRDRIIAETRGNPLALLELPQGLTATQLAGGFGPLGTQDLSAHIQESFLRQLRPLSDQGRRLLLLASAEPLGDPLLLWYAAQRLGIAPAATEEVEAQGLLTVGDRVRFRHPLLRSAVYQSAPLTERRSAHRALADATDPGVDPDRRAWHRAQATVGVDETVADELEHSAGRARSRGGAAAAAAFLTRSAELTPDAAERGRRTIAAAQATFDAGQSEEALALLATAELAPLDNLQRARLERLRAGITFVSTRGREAPALLLDAARRLRPLAPSMARETHLEAMAAAMFAGRLGHSHSIRETGEAALLAPSAPQPARATDLLLDGLATRFTAGYVAGVPGIRSALEAFGNPGTLSTGDARWLWLACRLAQDLWDDGLWRVLADSGVRMARQTGAVSMLPIALTYRAALHVHEGAFGPAAALLEEVDAITAATEAAPVKYGTMVLAAWSGDEAAAGKVIDEVMPDVAARGEGMAVGIQDWTYAVLHNANGRYADALAAAQRGCEHDDVGLYAWSLVELVEAGARCDATAVSAAALDRLIERARASGTEWALGVEACSRALLSGPQQAEPLYREAIARLDRSRGAVHATRARLLYGEWLRRQNRRVDAREQLRDAYQRFTRMGAKAFSDRARGELLATGETVRKRRPDTRDELTPQEKQIARLARQGFSNPDIGARLFLSPRTVEWHLAKVYAKLRIRSRHELSAALPNTGPELAQA
ncbi:AAA family ATPase [Microlunatus sp. Gsoil 973]|nr:AAA family ATPase [Microlunatus sp. Gsoil 973]